MRLASLVAFLICPFLSQGFAEEPKPIELVVEPRAIETPILKYRLFPNESEIKPGNATPILLRLPWEQTPFMSNVYPTLYEWETRPLDAPEWKTSGGVLPDTFYGEMKRAAYRREASWEYPLGETASPYMILLPDVQGLRGFLGAGLSARIRYHVSRGELDQAREGILVGLANGRHLSQTPFYICQLVALAIHRTMIDRTAEMISATSSPNLYWALSSLPDTLVNFDRAARLESEIFVMTFPAAKELDRPRDEGEWRRMAHQLFEMLVELGAIPRVDRPQEGESLVGRLLETLAPADKVILAGLIARARADLPKLLNVTEDEVKRMSDDEVGVRWYTNLRLAMDQRAAAVHLLRPREAWPELKKLKAETAAMREATGASGLDMVEPISIYLSTWSLKRRIAALRIIEAVRDHLAHHEGQCPATLEEIDTVPIPLDPLTELPFEWRVDGPVATLKAPPLPADVVEPATAMATQHHLEYRLRLK